MKVGIVVYPGANCDYDAYAAWKYVCGEEVHFIWHKSEDLGNADLVVLPGGFSYGDYLRCGAIAACSPIMKAVMRFAHSGGMVWGICNGFQILTETGLLPGALLRNVGLRFRCRFVTLRVEQNQSLFTSACRKGEVLRIPIQHGEGNYFAEPEQIRLLEDKGRVLFRYCDESGNVVPSANPNGAINSIAGIVSEGGNVLGMMPHPEKSVEAILGSADGLKIFESIRASIGRREVAA
jgi:phosphoribosylformylglycinamidine synthase subunit PurQ / glutaminase